MKVDMEIKMTKEEKQAITTIVNMLNQLSDGEESFLDEYLYDIQVPYVQDIKNGLLELREVANDIEEQPKEFHYE